MTKILTEEELNGIQFEAVGQMGLVVINTSDFEKMKVSHRSLLSANAELSFKNQGLKLSLEAIGMIVTGEIMSNNIDKHLYTVLGIVKCEIGGT